MATERFTVHLHEGDLPVLSSTTRLDGGSLAVAVRLTVRTGSACEVDVCGTAEQIDALAGALREGVLRVWFAPRATAAPADPRCDSCGGTGRRVTADDERCPACGGTGRAAEVGAGA